MDKNNPKVECIGKYFILQVNHNGIDYECVVSYDCKNLFECHPQPNDWVEIENIIRDAAYNLEIKNLDELG
jgi:hypothetical protein